MFFLCVSRASSFGLLTEYIKVANVNTEEYFDSDSNKFSRERWEYYPEGYSDYLDTRKFIQRGIRLFNNKQFSCLDLGAGGGFWLKSLVEMGCCSYTAIDLSAQMLQCLKDSYQECKIEIETFKYDLNAGLPNAILAKPFDIIIAVHSLEYLNELSLVINACDRCLSKNGIIVIVTKNVHGYIWRGFKHMADTFAPHSLGQKWRSFNDFNLLLPPTLAIVSTAPLDTRIPTMCNNVNDWYSFSGDGKFMRNFILRVVSSSIKSPLVNVDITSYHV